MFRWTITNGDFYNADDVEVSVFSILPVNLISFTGRQDNDRVILKWQTATEINNDHFVVERSTNGTDFLSTATVDGRGNSSIVKNYSSMTISKELKTPSYTTGCAR